MSDLTDVIVIGAGAAGLSAAAVLAEAGRDVLVLDEQPEPGGQIYRAVGSSEASRRAVLGSHYVRGAALVARARASGARFVEQATVWRVDADGSLCYSRDGRGYRIRARHLVVATGALERPVPIAGWTLPGVMTAGAAQIMLKTAGLVGTDAVLVGCGPLLYLVAGQMARAGEPPKALVEVNADDHWRTALAGLPGAIRSWPVLVEGLGMLAELRRTGIRRHTGARSIRLEGDERARAVTFVDSRGRSQSIGCELVLLHAGVVPNIQITSSLGLEHDWDELQACFRPRVGRDGQTALDRVWVAGDGAGIMGAAASAISGELAGMAVLEALGNPVQRRHREAAEAALARETHVRPFLDALYAPPMWLRRPEGDTIVCRCEEVSADAIRGYARLGCNGPNQTKAYGRPGMGPCQGRYCGLTVTELLAQENGSTPAETGYYRIRSPLKPITVGEMADLAGSVESD